MTTTLQNGTKIPDKYSRDWYADLSNNWNLLDSLIGQVASGTFQHDVIPSTTNTYKLGSSTNVWDAVYGNAYYLGTTPFGDIVTHNASEFAATSAIPTKTSDLDNDSGYISNTADCVHLAGAETISGDKTFTGAVVTHNITPETDNTYSLGSASYQWASVYAQTYYYNGTQWGLDRDNTWTGTNTYASLRIANRLIERGVIPSSNRSSYLYFIDKNNVELGRMLYRATSSGERRLWLGVNDNYLNGALDPTGTSIWNSINLYLRADGKAETTFSADLLPETNNAYNLGSSSYQWSSVYAQTYYYNGTAWGLDKENHWSFNQWVEHNSTPKVLLKDLRNDRTYSATDKYGGVMRWECVDKDNAPLSRISTQLRNDKAVLLQFAIYNENSSGAEFERTLRFVTNTSGESGQTSFYPEQSGTVNLGASGNKWLTFNGINPGALSIPNLSSHVDISANMVADSYGNIKFTPQIYGWVYVDFNVKSATITSGTEMYVQAKNNSLADTDFAINFIRPAGSYHVFVWMPVWANKQIILQINFSGFSVGKAYIYPCLGNV